MVSYTPSFYRTQRDGSRRSAEVIVPILLDLIQPGSVVDVGCGVGVWLSVFLMHGLQDVWGVDGAYVDRTLLEIPSERFQAADLSHPFQIGRQFDLAVSVEVAEHLPADRAKGFVRSLTALSSVVLFSAAIPHQGGVGHINEQWPDYWAERFSDEGYVAIDCIRPRVWNDERVEWWYAQNTVLYAERQRVEREPRLRDADKATGRRPLSLVHPRKYLEMLDWGTLVRALRRDLASVVPVEARLIFVDEQLRDDVRPHALPFLEHAGEYAGLPADDATALSELDRLRQGGALFIAFAQPAFWWLDHYRELHQCLRARYTCVLENERLIVFDLRSGGPS